MLHALLLWYWAWVLTLPEKKREKKGDQRRCNNHDGVLDSQFPLTITNARGFYILKTKSTEHFKANSQFWVSFDLLLNGERGCASWTKHVLRRLVWFVLTTEWMYYDFLGALWAIFQNCHQTCSKVNSLSHSSQSQYPPTYLPIPLPDATPTPTGCCCAVSQASRSVLWLIVINGTSKEEGKKKLFRVLLLLFLIKSWWVDLHCPWPKQEKRKRRKKRKAIKNNIKKSFGCKK